MKKMVKETLNERISPPMQGARAHAEKDQILKKIESLCRKESAECEERISEFEDSIPEEQTDDLEYYYAAIGKLDLIAQIRDIMSTH
jgi:hypothetical protein